MSSDKIPANKSRSKIKPLQDEVQSLKEEKADLLEEMYDNGLRTRPTIMSEIITKEKSVIEQINFMINECEKKTGRALPIRSTVACSSEFVHYNA